MAMAFSVLAHFYSNRNHIIEIIIDSRECVRKTFEGYWDHFRST